MHVPSSSCFLFFLQSSLPHPYLHSFPTRRSSDLFKNGRMCFPAGDDPDGRGVPQALFIDIPPLSLQYSISMNRRSEEHTSELQSRFDLVCRLLLEKKK